MEKKDFNFVHGEYYHIIQRGTRDEWILQFDRFDNNHLLLSLPYKTLCLAGDQFYKGTNWGSIVDIQHVRRATAEEINILESRSRAVTGPKDGYFVF